MQALDEGGRIKQVPRVMGVTSFPLDQYAHAGGSSLEVWYMAGVLGGTATTTITYATDRVYYTPFISPPGAPVLDRVGCCITTAAAAGKILRIGLYTNTDGIWMPGTLVTDFGTIAADPGSPPTLNSININQALTPSTVYWFACGSNGGPVLRTGSIPGGTRYFGTTGGSAFGAASTGSIKTEALYNDQITNGFTSEALIPSDTVANFPNGVVMRYSA